MGSEKTYACEEARASGSRDCVQKFESQHSCNVIVDRRIGKFHLRGTHLLLEAPGKPQSLEVECETLKHIVHSMLIHKPYSVTYNFEMRL